MDIEEFVEDLQNSLEGWRYSHGEFEGWADSVQSCDDLYSCYSKNGILYRINGSYREYVNQVILEDEGEYWRVCNGDGCWETHHIDDLEDYYKCPSCGKFTAAYTPDDFGDEILSPTSWQLEEGLFKAYEDFIQKFPMIPGFCDDIEAALFDLNNATSPEELAAALIYACHCEHVGGIISTDHGGLWMGDIQTISEQGLLGLWEQEEINDYLGL